MEKIMLDLTSVSNKTNIEGACRSQILADIMEFLESRYEGVRRISATEMTFPIAITELEGFTVDVGAIVGVKIPKFYDVPRKDGKFTPAYSCLNSIYEWEMDPATIRKKKREAEWLEIAKEHTIPAEEVVYDFREIDPDYEEN